MASFRSLWSGYLRALERRPITTKAFTGSTIAGAGDLTSQAILLGKKSGSTHESDNAHELDLRRTFSLLVFGCAYGGVFQHYLFLGYSRLWPVSQVASAARTRNVFITVCTHQLLVYPTCYFPAFFAITEKVRGRTFAEAYARCMEKAWPAYKVGLVMWTPAMFGQFLFVPLNLQVLWISTFSFCWMTFLSWSSL